VLTILRSRLCAEGVSVAVFSTAYNLLQKVNSQRRRTRANPNQAQNKKRVDDFAPAAALSGLMLFLWGPRLTAAAIGVSYFRDLGEVDRTSLLRDRRGTPCRRSLSGNITLPIRYEWIECCTISSGRQICRKTQRENNQQSFFLC
jgi:hypothetical protein